MNVRELIAEILVEIGLATDAGSISSGAFEMTRAMINRAMLEYNMQDFLHFTKSAVELEVGKDEYFIEEAPVKVASLTFRKNGEAYRLRRVPMDTFPIYKNDGLAYPSVFVYDRVFKDSKMVGRIRLNSVSSYPLVAVVNGNIEAYMSDTDVVCVPPEYLSLIRADVQYRLLANRDASDTLKAAKSFELNKVKSLIKEMNDAGIDSVAQSVDALDPIRTGYGRL